MSLHKILGGFSLGAVIVYLGCATVDTRYGISAKLASYLP